MARLRVVSTDPVNVRALRRAGHTVEIGKLTPAVLRAVRARPPGGVVIDLTRAPASGRDLGVWLRKSPATRHVPLVFVGGDRDAVQRIRRLLPDATYCSWRGIRGALRRALGRPPAQPVVPASVFAAYEGRPLAQKLGIKAGTTVRLIAPPQGFLQTLGALPADVRLRRGAGPGDLTLWFVTRRIALDRRIAAIRESLGKGGLWILWPKRNAAVRSDLTQAIVRGLGLANGLVDYKVCSVDETWTGLKFARRQPRRAS